MRRITMILLVAMLLPAVTGAQQSDIKTQDLLGKPISVLKKRCAQWGGHFQKRPNKAVPTYVCVADSEAQAIRSFLSITVELKKGKMTYVVKKATRIEGDSLERLYSEAYRANNDRDHDMQYPDEDRPCDVASWPPTKKITVLTACELYVELAMLVRSAYRN